MQAPYSGKELSAYEDLKEGQSDFSPEIKGIFCVSWGRARIVLGFVVYTNNLEY